MTTDSRLQYPATQRNRDAILDVLRRVLPPSGLVLEIASGSGEHIVHFAKAFPNLTFQPSDPDDKARGSIAAWTASESLANVLPPIDLDMTQDQGPSLPAKAILCINMIHISPWRATQALMKYAGSLLPQGAPLYLYGAYRRSGVVTVASNEEFDASLKSRNPEWGLRNLDDVAELAREAGLSGPDVIEMPANNLSVVFRRA